MKKTRTKKIILLSSISLVFFTLVACDRPVKINKIVYNNSDYDIKVTAFYPDDSNAIIIPKYSSDTLFVYEYYYNKAYSNYSSCSASGYDSLFVNDSVNTPIQKNLLSEDNWFYSVRSKRVGECSFTITNEDIE